MESVASTRDTKLRLEMDGKDEFYRLANSANKMLSELDNAYNDMAKADERFRIIMEATNDGYIDFYPNTEEVYISPEWIKIIGYKGSDGKELYKDYISKIHPDHIEKLKAKYEEIVKGNVDYINEEYKVITESGAEIWLQQRGKVVQRDERVILLG
jgi:PAS fold.